ncbi:hypothetical protein KM043_005084 [Ampulex compressa]|nr:hypothetical protein KM043_005084 [Ampulex compressa]
MGPVPRTAFASRESNVGFSRRIQKTIWRILLPPAQIARDDAFVSFGNSALAEQQVILATRVSALLRDTATLGKLAQRVLSSRICSHDYDVPRESVGKRNLKGMK